MECHFQQLSQFWIGSFQCLHDLFIFKFKDVSINFRNFQSFLSLFWALAHLKLAHLKRHEIVISVNVIISYHTDFRKVYLVSKSWSFFGSALIGLPFHLHSFLGIFHLFIKILGGYSISCLVSCWRTFPINDCVSVHFKYLVV